MNSHKGRRVNLGSGDSILLEMLRRWQRWSRQKATAPEKKRQKQQGRKKTRTIRKPTRQNSRTKTAEPADASAATQEAFRRLLRTRSAAVLWFILRCSALCSLWCATHCRSASARALRTVSRLFRLQGDINQGLLLALETCAQPFQSASADLSVPKTIQGFQPRTAFRHHLRKV